MPYFLGKPRLPFNDPAYYSAEFEFSYREARRYGFSNGTFANVIRDLVEKGFINPVEKGGLRGTGGTSNRFRLSLRWKDYGTACFQDIAWEGFVGKRCNIKF